MGNDLTQATEASVIADRRDQSGQKVWTEWRAPITSVGGIPGAIPMTSATGTLDPSLTPSSGPAVVTLIAGQAISAYQMVSVHSDGLAYLADVTNIADASQTVGIAVTSSLIGGQITVQQAGFLDNQGWNWALPGQTLYLGLAGTLTLNVPASPGSAFELSVGTTISNTEVGLKIGSPILLV